MVMEDTEKDRFDRQKFLGGEAQDRISEITVGIVGLGGGGSHIVQQLAHIGFQKYVIYDADTVSFSNLNRLVGATLDDARNNRKKVLVAERQILGLSPDAEVHCHQQRWQDAPDDLKVCHIAFGCVDSYGARQELEDFCRRYLVTLIDIGMDIVTGADGIPVIGGQIIVSSPGMACMRCMGFLTPEKLAQEQALYGGIGGKPQVVWSNGVLASTAVGIAVDKISSWTGSMGPYPYLLYDGNKMSVKPNRAIESLNGTCPHFPPDAVGPIEL